MQDIFDFKDLGPTPVKIQFSDTPPAIITCMKCKCISRKLMQDPCGHIFCKSCVQMNKALDCTNTNRRIPTTQFKDANEVSNIVSLLTVYCVHKNKGCEEITCLKDLEDHLSHNCQYSGSTSCEFCKKKVARKNYQQHQLKCRSRTWKCGDCKEEIKFHVPREEHLAVCMIYNAKCPNCQKIFPKQSITEHIVNCLPKERYQSYEISLPNMVPEDRPSVSSISEYNHIPQNQMHKSLSLNDKSYLMEQKPNMIPLETGKACLEQKEIHYKTPHYVWFIIGMMFLIQVISMVGVLMYTSDQKMLLENSDMQPLFKRQEEFEDKVMKMLTDQQNKMQQLEESIRAGKHIVQKRDDHIPFQANVGYGTKSVEDTETFYEKKQPKPKSGKAPKNHVKESRNEDTLREKVYDKNIKHVDAEKIKRDLQNEDKKHRKGGYRDQ